ncbi:MAG: SPFH domain-containing protein [Clostridia bacterium]
MSKFVMECPHCGKFAQAKTGFFSKKKIQCDCGYSMDVRTDKMSSCECSHCHNVVVFDQSKGASAKCPVCHEPINTLTERSNLFAFSCGQCGVRLQTSKGAEMYTCPVCDFENDIAKQLLKEKTQRDGLASIIKYEGSNDTIVWKHPIEDFNYGSQLIVHETQEAIFFKDGQALDLFGAGRYTLETQQLPLLEKLYKLPTDTQVTFHSEVYYINMATQMGIKWGTDSKVRLFDPASGLHLELGASGEFNIRVVDSRKLLLKVVGTNAVLSQSELLGTGTSKSLFRSLVMTQAKTYLAQVIKACSINVLEIDAELLHLSSALRDRINEVLAEYGLQMPEFYISRIVTPDDDPNYRLMKEQYAEQYLKVRQEQIRKSEAEAASQRKLVEAQTEAQLKMIGAQGSAEAMKIEKAAQAEAYRMQAEAEAAEMRMKGFTYQQQTTREVGLEAMQGGIGGGGGSGLGDIAGLGVTLGAMGGVMGITKEAMAPMFQASDPTGTGASADTWSCACGAKNIASKFCPECGKPKPMSDTWHCICGASNIQTRFCPECGKPQPKKLMWDCACGAKNITSKFCPECGQPKGE